MKTPRSAQPARSSCLDETGWRAGEVNIKTATCLKPAICLPGFISAVVSVWLVLIPVSAPCDAPTLSVSGLNTAHAVQLSLHGQDGTNYNIEISTNLTVWVPYLSLSPSNGVAIFSHDASATPGAMFFRASEQAIVTSPMLGLQASSFFSAQSIVTPEEGGTADILTPDFRHITLTVPPGCVAEPQTFRMSLITNIDGLPFAQGSFGAVMLEPEDLLFSGAAAL